VGRGIEAESGWSRQESREKLKSDGNLEKLD
jgi:hypothetical protein